MYTLLARLLVLDVLVVQGLILDPRTAQSVSYTHLTLPTKA